jgi:crotonobetainyl-CoA:carnitine CoA-transferase CaiB-like acyl-CoA transferase
LIRVADVLIENFRSNEIMLRLGLGYEVLREINPDLVYVSSSAYGNGGPLENMRSNEWITEAR